MALRQRKVRQRMAGNVKSGGNLFARVAVVLLGAAISLNDCVLADVGSVAEANCEDRAAAFAEMVSGNGELVIPSSAKRVDRLDELDKIAGLRKVVVEDGVSIEADAFRNCTSLVEVVVRARLEAIPQRTFARCLSLKRVVLPESVEVFRDHAFAGCSSLETIELPRRTQYFDPASFRYCSRLRKITVAEGNPHLKSVDGIVYSKDGTELMMTPCRYEREELVVPEGVLKIATETFMDTIGLKRVRLPASMTEIGIDCFVGASEIEHFEVDPRNAVYASQAGLLYLKDPRTLLRCPPAYAASTVEIPTGVVAIAWHAFKGSKASRISLPPGMQTFPGRFVFSGCSNLREVVMPDTIKDMGFDCFSQCPLLTRISLLKCGGDLAFENGFLVDTREKKLLYCAPVFSNGVIRLPNVVSRVKQGAFENLKENCRLEIPPEVVDVDFHDLLAIPAITAIAFAGDLPRGFRFYEPKHRCDLYVDCGLPRWRAFSSAMKTCVEEHGLVTNLKIHDTSVCVTNANDRLGRQDDGASRGITGCRRQMQR